MVGFSKNHAAYLPGLIVCAAAALLAIEPMRWLALTWRDPSYDSSGIIVFVVCVAVFVWSVSSPLRASCQWSTSGRYIGLGFLAASALVRLAGQMLAINTIGALTLVVDVFAIGLLLGLHQRTRAISPAWLAIAFAFSLPLERIVQRTIGYGLQHISADGACIVLQSLFDNVVCSGVRVVLDGTDVLVDLPCSGAQATLLLLLAFSLVACLARPSLKQALVGGAIALVAALVGNVLRIVILAVGIAHPEWIGDMNVMVQPWHDVVGLFTLALSCIPLVFWLQWGGLRPATLETVIPSRIARQGWWLDRQANAGGTSPLPLAGGLAVLGLAVVIVNLPRTPVDVARKEAAMTVPSWLAGHPAHPIPLTKQETQFFTQFGGTAAKARYGTHSLLLVRTSSPLRHLHAPEDCLRGLGFRVTYLGAKFSPVPTAVYRAVSPAGESFRIDVTFVSERGRMTTNVATAVWHWMQGTDRIWTAVQRITPEHAGSRQHDVFSQSVVAALELPASPKIFKVQGER